MAAGASRGLNTESDTDAWKSDIGNLLVLLIVEQGTDFQERGPRRRRATRTRLEMKRASPCRTVSMRQPGPGDGNRYTEPEARRARRGKSRPVPARPNQVIDPGNGEEAEAVSEDLQRKSRSFTGMFRSEGNLGWGISVQRASPPSQKTRPHKAAGTVGVKMSLSVLLQFRAWIAVGKTKLSIEIPPFIRTYKENLRFIRRFVLLISVK